jgi:hypothetical protein
MPEGKALKGHVPPLQREGTSSAGQAVALASGWLATEEVMRELGKARRTIQELAQQGRLKWRWSEREGMRPERVYRAEDVELLKSSARPKAQPRQRPKALPAPAEATLALSADATDYLKRILERWSNAPPQLALPLPPVPLTEKLWLNLDEASEYSGLARADLERLCRNGTLVARKSGGWKILRKSLEAFEG